MVLNEAVNDLGEIGVVKGVDALSAMARCRRKQLQAKRFGQPRERDFGSPHGV